MGQKNRLLVLWNEWRICRDIDLSIIFTRLSVLRVAFLRPRFCISNRRLSSRGLGPLLAARRFLRFLAREMLFVEVFDVLARDSASLLDSLDFTLPDCG